MVQEGPAKAAALYAFGLARDIVGILKDELGEFKCQITVVAGNGDVSFGIVVYLLFQGTLRGGLLTDCIMLRTQFVVR